MRMRALTLWQPWATLMATGAKAVETLRQQAAVPVVEVTQPTALALNGNGHHHAPEPPCLLSEATAQDALRLATGMGVPLETLSLRERVGVLATAADVAELVGARVRA